VLLHWRELRSTAEQPWDSLCDDLGGRGVHSVDEALVKLKFGPMHEALRQAVDRANVYRFAEAAAEPAKSVTPTPKPGTTAKAADPAPGSAAKPASPQAVETDPRIEKFLDKCQLFADRVRANLPADLTDSAGAPNAAGATTDDPLTSRTLSLHALRLPQLERRFSTAWPPAVRYILPSHEPGVSMEQTWAPVLAWIALQGLPMPGQRAAIFDRLLLRSALAETFSAMGIDGDRSWRAAAMVRVLLLQADQPALTLDSEAFWQEPDVRWLAGVNESDGVVYFSQERFEELLSWLQLPALLTLAGEAQTPAAETAALRKLEASIANTSKLAKQAGYKLETYLSLSKSQGASAPMQSSHVSAMPPAGEPEKVPSKTHPRAVLDVNKNR
jgi:hypothetical protein